MTLSDKQDTNLCMECDRFWDLWNKMFKREGNRFCYSYVTDEEIREADPDYCMELKENCTYEHH